MDKEHIAECADLWIANRDKHRADEISKLPAPVVLYLMETGQTTVAERHALRPWLSRLIERQEPPTK